ncbi:putative adenosine monophosphate-protein transferase Fic [Billgrantia azerbaijanica]|nr:putative adenosine monophosphate-protein transferase Fic [Halomonas azerbaijanica]
MMDKYGTGQDPYCYPESTTLRNLLDIRDEAELITVERELTLLATDAIQFSPPPYDLAYLQTLHRQLFSDLYPWAGAIRTIDIAKGETRFCHVPRIEAESHKLFDRLAQQDHFTPLPREPLIAAVAELYGDLNVVHPFREGNGRAQRLLFEHIVINCGYEISWEGLERREWLEANVAAYYCDYRPMTAIFRRCIGAPLSE